MCLCLFVVRCFLLKTPGLGGLLPGSSQPAEMHCARGEHQHHTGHFVLCDELLFKNPIGNEAGVPGMSVI